MNPKEQWYRVYVCEPGEPGIVVDPNTKEVKSLWVKPPTFKPAAPTLHVHHPDYFHPDVRVRIQHHRSSVQQKSAACGEKHDPRFIYIEEEHDPKDRCSACIAALEAAEKDHADASAALEQRRQAILAERARDEKNAQTLEAEFALEEPPTGH